MSASDIRKVETPKGTFEYDSDMPVSSLRTLFSGAQDSDLGKIVEALSSFVVAWPFSGDPTDMEAWDALKRSEFNAVVKGVMGDLGNLGEE